MAQSLLSYVSVREAITLCPLKGVGSLQERYSEATADVFFVGIERLPAHKAVLSVASSVFFKMFDGDWRESRERNIPAPTEYRWEAFKAAIDLLYSLSPITAPYNVNVVLFLLSSCVVSELVQVIHCLA